MNYNGKHHQNCQDFTWWIPADALPKESLMMVEWPKGNPPATHFACKVRDQTLRAAGFLGSFLLLTSWEEQSGQWQRRKPLRMAGLICLCGFKLIRMMEGKTCSFFFYVKFAVSFSKRFFLLALWRKWGNDMQWPTIAIFTIIPATPIPYGWCECLGGFSQRPFLPPAQCRHHLGFRLFSCNLLKC